MFPTMKSAHKANGILFCLMLAAMLIYSIPKVVQFAGEQPNAAELFADGKLLRKFETAYDRQFFLREPSIQIWANLQYALFREGASGVVIGSDGWLYTNQEYLIPNNYRSNLRSQAARIAAIEAELKKHNKQLILAPLPMKLDIYPEHATRPWDPRMPKVYEDFLAELAAHQVETVPLRALFLEQKDQTPLFFKKDTHWTPEGARLAARQIALAHPELVGSTAFQSRMVSEKPLKSDLMNFIQFGAWLDPELFAESSVVPVYETLADDAERSADDLFGDQSQSIMLVGTSYTKIEDWNFAGFLREALQNDLLTIAVEGRGPFHAMDEFMNSEYLTNTEITQVIWEFPVRTVLAQRPNSKSWQTALNDQL